ncbi:YdhR family protein [Natronolimnobius sp. AArcel1]|uniref:YdhR family protein n=1 Tax=Natronolimnobius sp. AArcel1 TaxID=1679093 RepID=UPI0013EDD004|nr:YdhR family protein [Natronolimnobius sp. AArcel1]NGM70397.1 YdhR family protein [Natronolimnobius sp. AArcel1]
MPNDRVGDVVRTADGQSFTIYRETTVERPADESSVSEAVLAFQFQLRFMPAPSVPYATRVFEPLSFLTTPFFAGLPGFRTKLWLFDHDTGDYLGIYQWETLNDARRYAQALQKLMAVLSSPNSLSYEIAEEMSLDEYLATRSPNPRHSSGSASGN